VCEFSSLDIFLTIRIRCVGTLQTVVWRLFSPLGPRHFVKKSFILTSRKYFCEILPCVIIYLITSLFFYGFQNKLLSLKTDKASFRFRYFKWKYIIRNMNILTANTTKVVFRITYDLIFFWPIYER